VILELAFGGAGKVKWPVVGILRNFGGFHWLRELILERTVLGQEPGDAPRAIAVHPSGDELVCATAKGCRCVTLLLFSYSLLVVRFSQELDACVLLQTSDSVELEFS